ncbi:lipocalin family protein [Nocardia niigatensis]|uniref:lipocalin family protein n=1 Tax=Nocardia niigatensis TaxID=209249 RepID=UPI00030DF559|nr:lipocalin family protein [Nocardia niigatensis]
MNRNRLRPIACAVAVFVAAVATASVVPASASAESPPQPVPQLDTARYLGTWNQLAAIPQYFNLNCARDTQAEYTLDPDGDIAVRNTCTTWASTTNEIRGTATINDPVTRAQLHVSFPGVPTQDSRTGPTNYIVTALADDYSWALVTDPYRLSGFVLSRPAQLDQAQWDRVRTAIAAAGEDACLYLTSPTTGGLDRIAPLCSV